jgi:hypothetical protein
MEEQRMAVTLEQIRGHFELRSDSGFDTSCHFVFKMDDMGYPNWAGRGPVMCCMPVEDQRNLLHFAVSGTCKWNTLIACISADGSYAKFGVIIPRKTSDDDDDDEIGASGWTQNKCLISILSKSLIDTVIFGDWLQAISACVLNEPRQRQSYPSPAFLLLDNSPAHRSKDFDTMCGENKVTPLLVPPHSSNHLHPLQLYAFGVTNKLIRFNRLGKGRILTDHIIQVVAGFMQVVLETNVVSSS